jgi:hypothetical protein
MKVEVLYFKGCPNYESAVAQVRKAVSEEHVSAVVEEVEVRDAAMAQEIGFLGSPTIRVNGLDIEEGARTAVGFGFGCRTYLAAGHRSGIPSISSIRHALAEAAGSTGEQV